MFYSRFTIIFCLLLSGCVTAQYLHQKSLCHQEALLMFPPNYVTQQVVKTRQVEKFDGTVTCTKANNVNTNDKINSPYDYPSYPSAYPSYPSSYPNTQSNQVEVTKCVQGKKTVEEEYLAFEKVDLNLSARDNFTLDCARTNCMRIYGNSSCEIK